MENQVLSLEVEAIEVRDDGLTLRPAPFRHPVTPGEVAAVFMRPDGSNLNHRLRFERTDGAYDVIAPHLPRTEVPAGTRVFVAESLLASV